MASTTREPAMAEPPTATPTIATSTAFFDILASPVTIRGQARAVARRARSSVMTPARANRSPTPRIAPLTGLGGRNAYSGLAESVDVHIGCHLRAILPEVHST